MDVGSMIAGGIIGFIAAIVKDYLADKRKEKEREKQFKREKLETLYEDISNQHHSMITDMQSSYKGHLISARLRFYFPTVFESYREYLNTIGETEILSDSTKTKYHNILDLLTEESRKINK